MKIEIEFFDAPPWHLRQALGRGVFEVVRVGAGPRVRVGGVKLRLQEFADETGLAVTVCHYPPGGS